MGLKKFLDPIFTGLRFLTGLLLTGMVAVQAYEIALREFTGRTPAWSKELTLLLMVWVGFLASADLLRSRGHIAVEFVVNALPGRGRQALVILADLLVFVFAGFLFYAGVALVREFLHQSLPGTSLPVGIAYLPMPAAGALMALAGLELIWRDLRGEIES